MRSKSDAVWSKSTTSCTYVCTFMSGWACLMTPATRSSSFCRRATRAMAAALDSRASSCAMASPIPDEAPTTIARLIVTAIVG